MKLITVLIALSLCSCAILSDRRVAAGCQVADGATTFYALKHGATESNHLISGLSPGGILALKFAFAYAIFKMLPDREHATSGDKAVGGTLSVIGCAPVPNNIKVIRGLK